MPVELVGGAFSENENLVSAAIPHGVVRLTGNTFKGCVSLTSVSLPGTLDYLGTGCFENCSAISSVYIPPLVTVLDVYLFDGCTSLKELHLPDHISFTGYRTFSGQLLWCRADTDTARYLSVNRTPFISPSAPDYMIRYRDIGGTSSAAEISDTLIITKYLGSARKVVIPPSIDGLSIEIINSGAFRGSQTITSAVIPDGVTIIEFCAFNSCPYLKSITIPASVTAICQSAFEYSTGLTDVFFTGTEAQWSALRETAGPFNNSLFDAALHSNSPLFSRILQLPRSLRVIESKSFACLDSVDAIRIPAGVDSIAADAFDRGMVLYVPSVKWAQWASDNGYIPIVE